MLVETGERTATIFDLRDGSVQTAPRETLAFSPVGTGRMRLLAPFTENVGREDRYGWCLLDTTTGEKIATATTARTATLAAAFSPDGKRFVTSGRDNATRVWDAEHHDELVRLSGQTDYVFRLAFSPDSKRLYSTSGDHTARAWDTTPLSSVSLTRQRR